MNSDGCIDGVPRIGDNGAVTDQDDALGVARHLRVVGDQEDGHALRVEIGEELHHLLGGL
jgi:hypothetical protein